MELINRIIRGSGKGNAAGQREVSNHARRTCGGSLGTAAAHQKVTVGLACDGLIHTTVVRGAGGTESFRAGSGDAGHRAGSGQNEHCAVLDDEILVSRERDGKSAVPERATLHREVIQKVGGGQRHAERHAGGAGVIS